VTRVLLFTGKGGVGKTSVAAATAVRAAERGARVLVTSTDPAHSLADALAAPLGDEATRVEAPGHLEAQQIDAQARLERHWREIRDYLVALLAWGGADGVEAEELLLLPGLDELFSLVDLRAQVASGAHDLVVVDCAPTAETLRLLALPEALRWYVERMLQPSRRMARAVRPLTRGLGRSGEGLPVPDDGVFGAVERVHADLAAVHALLQDPDRSSVRLVVNAERLVVAETQRMATSLSLFGYGVDAVAVNRLLPDQVADPYLADHKRRQAEHLEEVHAAFSPVPVLTAPLLPEEAVGVGPLGRLAEELYGSHDECEVLHLDRPVEVVDDGDARVLHVALPFTDRGDVELNRRGGQLHLRVAGVRRTIDLPGALARFEVDRARVADGALEVRFVPAVTSAEAS
jgi:arsenite/tail-anchored protein-transporting ATPase